MAFCSSSGGVGIWTARRSPVSSRPVPCEVESTLCKVGFHSDERIAEIIGINRCFRQQCLDVLVEGDLGRCDSHWDVPMEGHATDKNQNGARGHPASPGCRPSSVNVSLLEPRRSVFMSFAVSKGSGRPIRSTVAPRRPPPEVKSARSPSG